MKRSQRLQSRAPIWSAEGVDPLPGIPLLAHVTRLAEESPSAPLANGGWPLPNEPWPHADQDGWVESAFEGVLSLRGCSSPPDDAQLAVSAILEACRLPLSTTAVHVVAERLNGMRWPDQLDQLLAAIRTSKRVEVERLAELARWLCTFGVTAGQVKVGIAVLGLVGRPRDADLVSTLGRLEALTLYALVALQNLLAAPTAALFELAKRVDGWGRIYAIHHLAGTTNPAVQQWLLRGGYENGVMVEEVAYIAATTGGLATALQGEVDDELLDHAGELLQALACGGPAEDMSDYAEGGIALQLYLQHLAEREMTLTRLTHLGVVVHYLRDHASSDPHLDTETCRRLAQLADEIVTRDECRMLVEASLTGENFEHMTRALHLAPRFGLDSAPIVLEWLDRRPHESLLWYYATEGASDSEIEELIDRADALLPFSALPHGPSLSLGLGAEFDLNECFEYVLQVLDEHPGVGWRAISVGLSNSVVRCRNAALRALEAWEVSDLPTGIADRLRECLDVEPDEDLRARFDALLQKVGPSI